MLLVVGEALVDLVIDPVGRVEAALGGAPFNAARAAARLGADVEFAGSLSTDRFGTLLRQQLISDGVSVAYAEVVDQPTTLAAAQLDDGGAAEYRFYVDGTSARLVRDRTALTSAAASAAALLTGGLGLVLDPMATTVGSLIAHAGDDTLVVVDVNCRPLIVSDRDGYFERVRSAITRADIVKVSDEDLDYLSPGMATSDAGRLLIEQGAGSVIVTGGAAHTTVLTAGAELALDVPPLDAPLVDTIGAGDTFIGGLVAWWLLSGRGRTGLDPDALAAAVVAGQRAAAVVVTRRGADPPYRSDLADDWAPDQTR